MKSQKVLSLVNNYNQRKNEKELMCRLNRRWWLWIQSEKKCALCDQVVEHYEDASIDHIIPRSKGGQDTDSNIQLSHSWCNSFKDDMWPWQERLFRFFAKAFYKVRHGRISKNPQLKETRRHNKNQATE